MEEKKEKFYKRWWFWAIIVVVLLIVIGGSSENSNSMTETNIATNESIIPKEKVEVVVVNFSTMEKKDIQQWCDANKIVCGITEEYSATVEKGAFISQSVKENEKIYQGDKITVSYSLGKEPSIGQKNALAKAKSYLAYSAFSYNGLIKQLEFEGFTTEEATYGTDNCGADWNEQASKKAKSYMDYSSFSKEGLIGQLEYEGFTKEQAQYGAKAVGY